MEFLMQYVDRFIPVLLMITISISFRVLLEFLGQRWITTVAHTATLVLLPILTYVITGVISGNIALSLGMVGALSIVRFRNPVRSPLELSVYFGSITMGIAASVNLMWLFFLVFSVSVAAGALVMMNYLSLVFLNRPFFYASFSEGNSLSTLNLTTPNQIDLLDNSNLLKTKRLERDSINYYLVSSNFDELKEIIQTLEAENLIGSYELNQ
tara:strand:- start:1926 stop:2558 length:633 start_codon:yes stop_codon:yes gene_type:complete